MIKQFYELYVSILFIEPVVVSYIFEKQALTLTN
jgi:hypothetical protein